MRVQEKIVRFSVCSRYKSFEDFSNDGQIRNSQESKSILMASFYLLLSSRLFLSEFWLYHSKNKTRNLQLKLWSEYWIFFAFSLFAREKKCFIEIWFSFCFLPFPSFPFPILSLSFPVKSFSSFWRCFKPPNSVHLTAYNVNVKKIWKPN